MMEGDWDAANEREYKTPYYSGSVTPKKGHKRGRSSSSAIGFVQQKKANNNILLSRTGTSNAFLQVQKNQV